TASKNPPLTRHRASEHCLGAVGADGNDLDRLADELANAVEIAASAGGKVFESPDFGDVGLPAGEGFVDRLSAAEVVGVAGEAIDTLAVKVVGDADFDFRQVAEHVHHHQRDAIDPREPGGIADGDGIEPAAAARSAGGGAR